VPLPEIKRILAHLGFMVAGAGPVVKVAVPSWRSDVHGKADIVEEIVRIVGVDQVPMSPFGRGDNPRKPILNPIQLRTRRAKRALAARGMVGRDVVVHRKTPPNCSAASELSLAAPLHRSLRHAAEPAAGPDRSAGEANRGFPIWRCSRSAGIQGDKPEASWSRPPACAMALRPEMGRHWSVRHGGRARRQGRRVRGAGGKRADAGAADRYDGRWLHPDVPAPSDWPANVLGYFGELHPRTLEALGADSPRSRSR
jgi:phenylalanyl-tRNA synthetase beta chain